MKTKQPYQQNAKQSALIGGGRAKVGNTISKNINGRDVSPVKNGSRSHRRNVTAADNYDSTSQLRSNEHILDQSLENSQRIYSEIKSDYQETLGNIHRPLNAISINDCVSRDKIDYLTQNIVQKNCKKDYRTGMLKVQDEEYDLNQPDDEILLRPQQVSFNKQIQETEINETKVEDIKTQYLDNQAYKLHQKLQDPDIYMQKVLKRIKLSELYEIVDYYYTGKQQVICPVLLKIKNKDILKEENRQPASSDVNSNKDSTQNVGKVQVDNLAGSQSMTGLKAMNSKLSNKKQEAKSNRNTEEIKEPVHFIQYLLQVWRKSDGIMIYERKLKNPPKGWGLYMNKQENESFDDAMNMFFYQENKDETDFYEPIIGLTYGSKSSLRSSQDEQTEGTPVAQVTKKAGGFFSPSRLAQTKNAVTQLANKTVDQIIEDSEDGEEEPSGEDNIRVFKFNFSNEPHPILDAKKKEYFSIPEFTLDQGQEDPEQNVEGINSGSQHRILKKDNFRVQPVQSEQRESSHFDLSTDDGPKTYEPEINLAKDEGLVHEMQQDLIRVHNQNQSKFAKQIRRNICFVDGKIILAQQSYLVQLDISKLFLTDESKPLENPRKSEPSVNDWKSVLFKEKEKPFFGQNKKLRKMTKISEKITKLMEPLNRTSVEEFEKIVNIVKRDMLNVEQYEEGRIAQVIVCQQNDQKVQEFEVAMEALSYCILHIAKKNPETSEDFKAIYKTTKMKEDFIDAFQPIVNESTGALREIMQRENEKVMSFVFETPQIDVISIQNNYKFVNFIDTGSEGQAMIIENENTKQVRFVLVTCNPEFVDQDQVKQVKFRNKSQAENEQTGIPNQQAMEQTDEEKSALVFEQLGLVQSKEEGVQASIVKICQVQSFIKAPHDDDGNYEKKYFNVCLILRSNGNVQVFSDFEYTHTIDAMDESQVDQKEPCKDREELQEKKEESAKKPKPQLFCVDIECDSEYFYFKYMKLDTKTLNIWRDRPKFVIRKVSNQWRSCIKYTQTKKEQAATKWDSCKLKSLSSYMRLYPVWLVFQGHFLITHRGYISVFNLNSDEDINEDGPPEIQKKGEPTKPVQKKRQVPDDNWVQHFKVDRDSKSHIREMFLEKQIRKTANDKIQELKFHSQPLYSLYKRFIVNVVLGANKIVQFKYKHGQLKLLNKLRTENESLITNFYADKVNRQGSFIVVAKPSKFTFSEKNQEQQNEQEEDLSDETYEQIKSANPHPHYQAHDQIQDFHYIYQNVIETGTKEAKYFRTIHQNYCEQRIVSEWSTEQHEDEEEEVNSPRFKLRKKETMLKRFNTALLEDQQKSVMPRTSINENDVQQRTKNDESEKDDSFSLEGKIMLIQTTKSFWKEELDQKVAIGKKCKSSDNFKNMIIDSSVQKKKSVYAMLIYKKNHYLKLVPFIKKEGQQKQREANPEKGQINEGKTQIRSTKDDDLPYVLFDHKKAEMNHGDHILETAAEVTLLDKHACSTALKDQEFLMFQLVDNNKTVKDIDDNSFVIITNSQIHVYDNKKNEIHRYSGFDIKTALVIDSSYLYMQEEWCDQVYHQEADPENDHQISDVRNKCGKVGGYVQEPGFTAVNFFALFHGNFFETAITTAACGLNGLISKSMTQNDISVLNHLQEMSILPLPHQNLMSFVGMGSKNQYLLWKSSIDGFFTALDKKGKLLTWSCVTGKLLWTENQENDCKRENLKDYRVYRSDEGDISYLGDEYTHNKAMDPKKCNSISLLVSLYPVDWNQTQIELDQRRRELQLAYQSLDQEEPALEEQYEACKRIQQEISDQRSKNIIPDSTRNMFNYDDEISSFPADAGLFRKEIDFQNETKKVKFSKKARRMKLYHFKVLQLRQVEDMVRAQEDEYYDAPYNKRKNLPGPDNPEEKISTKKYKYESECKMLFHFFHKLLHPYKQKKNTDQDKCDWFLSNENIKQRLYLSLGAKKMLEVVQNRIANLMVRDLHDEFGQEKEDNGQLVCWQLEHTLPNFPFYAFEISSLPYFISDDFEHYCEFDYDKRQMHVVKMHDKHGLGKIVGTLPEEAISLTHQNLEKEMIKEAFACVQIKGNEGDESIMTYNYKSGLLTKWEILDKEQNQLTQEEKDIIRSTNELINKNNRFKLEELKFNMTTEERWKSSEKFRILQRQSNIVKKTLDVQNGITMRKKRSNIDSETEFDGKHFFLENDQKYTQYQVIDRLIARTDAFNRAMTIRGVRKDEARHQYSTIDKKQFPDAQLKRRIIVKSQEVLDELMEIDYSQDWHSPKASFQIDNSFTWIDWKKASNLYKNENCSFEDFLQDEKLRLMFNIFPSGQSFLQMLAFPQMQTSKSTSVFKEDSASECKAIFVAAQHGLDFKINGEWTNFVIEVPIITDCYGMQPLDYAFGSLSRQKDKTEYRYLTLPENLERTIKQAENLELVQVMLEHTKKYASFTNTINMVYPIILAIKSKLPEAFNYLDCRLVKTNHIPTSIHNELDEKYVQSTPLLGKYGIIPIDDLTNTKEAYNIFKTDKIGKTPQEKKKMYDFNWFDIPLIFDSTPEGADLMQALSRNESKDIYSHKGVQLLVENQWEQWFWWHYLLIQIPMGIQVVSFTIKSSIIDTNEENANKTFKIILEVLSFVIALYFLILDLAMTCIDFCRGQGRLFSKDFKVQFPTIFLNVLSPLLILTCDIFAEFAPLYYEHLEDSVDGNKGDKIRPYRPNPKWYYIYWELVAWTTFFLWLKFALMLRAERKMSPAITMVLESFKQMLPYLTIVVCGVLCFAASFQALEQIVYVESNFNTLDRAEVIRPPFQKSPEPRSLQEFDDYKNMWLGEYITFLKKQIIGSVAGFDGEGTELYQDRHWVLYIVCIIFNIVVLMNLLLALVGTVHSEVHEMREEHTYQQLVSQICILQRVMRPCHRTKRNTQQLLFMAIQRRVDNDAALELNTKKETAVAEEAETQSANLESLKETLMLLNDKIEKSNEAIDNLKKKSKQDSRQGPSAIIVKKKSTAGKGKRQ